MNTLYKNIPGARCCHNCEPDKFVAEEVVLERKPGLKRGTKKMATEEFQEFLKERLVVWRDELLTKHYGDSVSIAAEALMSDEIINKIASMEKRILTEDDLRSRIRWTLGGVTPGSASLGENGRALLEVLADIYAEYDAAHPVEEDEEDKDDEDDGKRKRSKWGKQVLHEGGEVEQELRFGMVDKCLE